MQQEKYIAKGGPHGHGVGSCWMLTFQMLIMSHFEQGKHDAWELYSGSGRRWVMSGAARANFEAHVVFRCTELVCDTSGMAEKKENPGVHLNPTTLDHFSPQFPTFFLFTDELEKATDDSRD